MLDQQKTESAIKQIAATHLFFETLETSLSGADFKEVAVWQVKVALKAAYVAGWTDRMIASLDEKK